MKRLCILLVTLLLATTSHASRRANGPGDPARTDPSSLPDEMRSSYQLMEAKCVPCHSLERVFVAVRTGIAPITGVEFTRESARAHTLKMMRKPAANIKAQEAEAIAGLLAYLIDENGK